ncbi:O-methyltransferase [Penicillium atrosanguineum]|uniref:O-methyltransferase n=1 Tax=Penicillium atrosanguineum TaxID=1132637 RepID=UPI002399FE7F|nr:O-methyltransferase [Penicillium atrosanguineum]KAJ5313483.1 O-methyltransferase [Penicillium atrosanguineum]
MARISEAKIQASQIARLKAHRQLEIEDDTEKQVVVEKYVRDVYESRPSWNFQSSIDRQDLKERPCNTFDYMPKSIQAFGEDFIEDQLYELLKAMRNMWLDEGPRKKQQSSKKSSNRSPNSKKKPHLESERKPKSKVEQKPKIQDTKDKSVCSKRFKLERKKAQGFSELVREPALPSDSDSNPLSDSDQSDYDGPHYQKSKDDDEVYGDEDQLENDTNEGQGPEPITNKAHPYSVLPKLVPVTHSNGKQTPMQPQHFETPDYDYEAPPPQSLRNGKMARKAGPMKVVQPVESSDEETLARDIHDDEIRTAPARKQKMSRDDQDDDAPLVEVLRIQSALVRTRAHAVLPPRSVEWAPSTSSSEISGSARGTKRASTDSHGSSAKKSRLDDPHPRVPQERREDFKAIAENYEQELRESAMDDTKRENSIASSEEDEEENIEEIDDFDSDSAESSEDETLKVTIFNNAASKGGFTVKRGPMNEKKQESDDLGSTESSKDEATKAKVLKRATRGFTMKCAPMKRGPLKRRKQECEDYEDSDSDCSSEDEAPKAKIAKEALKKGDEQETDASFVPQGTELEFPVEAPR